MSWSWRRNVHYVMVAALVVTTSREGNAQSGHIPIHAPDRVFKPSDVHARLRAPTMLEKPFEGLLKHVASNPEHLKTLLGAASRAQNLLGDDQAIPKSASMNQRLAELAKKIGSDPELQKQILEDPEFRKLAEDLREKIPPSLLDSMRNQFGPNVAKNDTGGIPGFEDRSEPVREQKPAAPPSSAVTDRRSPKPSLPSEVPPPENMPARQRSNEIAESPGLTSRHGNEPQRPSGQGNLTGSDSDSIRRKDSGPGRFDPVGPGSSGRLADALGQEERSEAPVTKFKPTTGQGEGLSDQLLRAASRLQRLEGPLAESESLRQAITQLRTGRISTGEDRATRLVQSVTETASHWKEAVGDFQKRTASTRDWGESLAQSTRSWLPSPPSLPALPRISPPAISLPKLPAAPAPALPAIRVPEGFHVSWSIAAVAIVIALMGAGLYWLRMGTAMPATAAERMQRELQASSIRDRTSFRLSFERLVTYLLGDRARRLHHREIARQIGSGNPSLASAANDLSGLYEQARYAPPSDELTEQDLLLASEQYSHLARNRPI